MPTMTSRGITLVPLQVGEKDSETQVIMVRPQSVRKACDLCHQAKQKCSGDKPACQRCIQAGWPCHYALRQRRKNVGVPLGPRAGPTRYPKGRKGRGTAHREGSGSQAGGPGNASGSGTRSTEGEVRREGGSGGNARERGGDDGEGDDDGSEGSSYDREESYSSRLQYHSDGPQTYSPGGTALPRHSRTGYPDEDEDDDEEDEDDSEDGDHRQGGQPGAQRNDLNRDADGDSDSDNLQNPRVYSRQRRNYSEEDQEEEDDDDDDDDMRGFLPVHISHFQAQADRDDVLEIRPLNSDRINLSGGGNGIGGSSTCPGTSLGGYSHYNGQRQGQGPNRTPPSNRIAPSLNGKYGMVLPSQIPLLEATRRNTSLAHRDRGSLLGNNSNGSGIQTKRKIAESDVRSTSPPRPRKVPRVGNGSGRDGLGVSDGMTEKFRSGSGSRARGAPVEIAGDGSDPYLDRHIGVKVLLNADDYVAIIDSTDLLPDITFARYIDDLAPLAMVDVPAETFTPRLYPPSPPRPSMQRGAPTEDIEVELPHLSDLMTLPVSAGTIGTFISERSRSAPETALSEQEQIRRAGEVAEQVVREALRQEAEDRRDTEARILEEAENSLNPRGHEIGISDARSTSHPSSRIIQPQEDGNQHIPARTEPTADTAVSALQRAIYSAFIAQAAGEELRMREISAAFTNEEENQVHPEAAQVAEMQEAAMQVDEDFLPMPINDRTTTREHNMVVAEVGSPEIANTSLPLREQASSMTVDALPRAPAQSNTAPPERRYPFCAHSVHLSDVLTDLSKLDMSRILLTEVFPPLSACLELLIQLPNCDVCSCDPRQAIPQLALICQICSILSKPHPRTPNPLPLMIAGGNMVGTKLAPEMEVHIVDIVWANWKGPVMRKALGAFIDRAATQLLEQQRQLEGTSVSLEWKRSKVMLAALRALELTTE